MLFSIGEFAKQRQEKCEAEFQTVAEELQPTYGNVVITRLGRQSKDSVILIKQWPDDIRDLGSICSKEQYWSKYDCPLHPTFTPNVKNTLLTNGHVSAGFFNCCRVFIFYDKNATLAR